MIVPSKMMICGTVTLPYLFRIHLFGVGAKVEDSIISGLVTRQGGTIYNTQYVTYPIAFKTVLCITAAASNKTEAVNLYDITMTTVKLHNNGGTPNFTKWLAFGM